jgi:hypothetical protein
MGSSHLAFSYLGFTFMADAPVSIFMLIIHGKTVEAQIFLHHARYPALSNKRDVNR